MIKILIVTSTNFPPLEGLGTHIDSIAKKLDSLGCNVTVLTRGNIDKKNNYSLISEKVTNIPIINNLIFSQKIKRMIEADKFDLLYYHTPLIYPPKLKNKVKTISTFHSTMKFDTSFTKINNINSLLNRIGGLSYARVFEKRLIKVSDVIFAVSDGVKSEIEQQFNLNKKILKVIPNSIDLDIFKNKKEQRGEDLLYVGRIGYRKGIKELASALRECSELFRSSNKSFIFYGDGEYRNWLINFIKINSLNDFVKVDEASHDEIADILNKNKILFITSSYETGPRVLLEGMASGCLVYSTEVGLAKKIPGHLYKHISDSSTDSIVEALQDAMQMNDGDVRVIGDSAASYAKSHFGVDSLAKEILS